MHLAVVISGYYLVINGFLTVMESIRGLVSAAHVRHGACVPAGAALQRDREYN